MASKMSVSGEQDTEKGERWVKCVCCVLFYSVSFKNYRTCSSVTGCSCRFVLPGFSHVFIHTNKSVCWLCRKMGHIVNICCSARTQTRQVREIRLPEVTILYTENSTHAHKITWTLKITAHHSQSCMVDLFSNIPLTQPTVKLVSFPKTHIPNQLKFLFMSDLLHVPSSLWTKGFLCWEET